MLFLVYFLLVVGVMSQKLLYEPNAPDYKTQRMAQSLFDKLAPDPSLSTFMDVLTQVDDIFRLVNHSSSDHAPHDGPAVITMFVPTNAAFRYGRQQGSSPMPFMSGHPSDWEAFLKYHIVPYAIETVAKDQQVSTLLGKDEKIDIHYHAWSRRVDLNHGTANVIDHRHPVRAINGVAFKIDRLLKQP
ncbi:hypothetical protein BDF20DRAFT_901494 [Mycotypha africana]|uniref:uncharacterized protein n=1 Tax=Mycotypha africana TaxID=64632 RepID=UPI0023002B7D|nr:uncharacterized protein BDF20DRAFT_901494 [Mycotypha africana]KAI8967256.1 hypothetical protein BDF20DRAFT_901494 [Mycotypha africana]